MQGVALDRPCCTMDAWRFCAPIPAAAERERRKSTIHGPHPGQRSPTALGKLDATMSACNSTAVSCCSLVAICGWLATAMRARHCSILGVGSGSRLPRPAKCVGFIRRSYCGMAACWPGAELFERRPRVKSMIRRNARGSRRLLWVWPGAERLALGSRTDGC